MENKGQDCKKSITSQSYSHNTNGNNANYRLYSHSKESKILYIYKKKASRLQNNLFLQGRNLGPLHQWRQ